MLNLLSHYQIQILLELIIIFVFFLNLVLVLFLSYLKTFLVWYFISHNLKFNYMPEHFFIPLYLV